MTVQEILKAALAVVQRDHSTVQLAVDQYGAKVRPLDPRAVAWSSTGAICKVAPMRSADDPSVWADHIPAGLDAYELLERAAREHGHASVAACDEAGQDAAARMFWRALQLDQTETRRRRAKRSRAGSNPRGEPGVPAA